MATTIDQLELDISSNSSSAIKELDKLASSLGKLKSATGNLGLGNATKQFNNLTPAVNNSAKSFTDLAAKVASAMVVMRKLAAVVGDCISQAVEWDGVSQRFGRAFGDSAQESYEWIKRLNKEMGINTQLFMQFSSVYGTMLTGYGVAQKDAATMAMGYAELTYDIWAGFNDIYKTYEEAAIAVRSAIAGEVEPIRKAGFTIVDSQLKATAAMYGIEYSTQSATEELKSYLRYLTLVNQAYDQNLVGTYAREMNTAEGLLRTLKQQLSSLAQTFGSVFLPVLSKVLPYIQAFVALIREAIVSVAALFGVEIQPVDFSQSFGFGGAETATEGIEDNLGGAAKKAKEVKNALLGIDELNVISQPEDSSGGSGASAGGGGYGGMFDLEKLWDESIFENINSQADELKEKLKQILPTVGAIAAGFAAWKLAKGLLTGLATLKKTMQTLGSTMSVPLAIVGLANFLADLDKFKKYLEDFMENGATFENVAGMISQFAGMVGDAFILLGRVKIGGALQIIDGIGTIVAEISDIAKNGADVESVLGVIDGLSEIAIGVGLLTGKFNVVGWGMALQGFTTIITEISTNWEAIKNGDWSGVDKATLIIGAIELIGGIATALGAFKKIKDAVDTGGAVQAMTEVTTATEAVNTTTSNLTSKLTDLVKNLGLGIAIIAEVAVATGLVIAAVWGLGLLLEQVGIAWQPVIDNAGTVAIAIGVGTGLLVAIGVVTAALGTLGGAVCGQIAIGIAILAELGVAAGLFIVEIWAIGKGLDEIGKAWQPVLDNGETIATGIGLGTALLVGIGVVTAALGVATVASAGLLPLAIGLGTALLVELAAATVLFIESLVAVSNELGNNLAPALDDLNGKLPALTTNMSDFVDFMCAFAGEVVRYTGASAVAGISATIDTIIGWFTQDPIEKLANDVDNIAGQASDLNDKLNVAVPELETAVDLLSEYVDFVDQLGVVAGSSGTVNLSEGLKTNLNTVGQNIVTGFNDGVKSKYSLVQSTMTNWGTDAQKWFNNSSYGGVNKEKWQTYANDIVNGFKDKISSSYSSSKSSMTTWATNVKNWFTQNSYGGVNKEKFATYAKDVIDGFSNKISTYSSQSKTAITTWATNIMKWFKESIGYNAFYNIAKDVIDGFNKGINDYYDTTEYYMRKWARAAEAAYKKELDSNSPSKVFMGIGEDTVLGYNLGILNLGKTTKGIVSSWAESFTSVSPVMSFAVDTSALRYYTSDSFAREITETVSANNRYTVDNSFSIESMKDAVMQALVETGLVEDVRRQADKKEQTIVQIGNRTVSDAVTTQQKANGYVFAK